MTIFVVPGLGYHWGILQSTASACGITPEHLIDAPSYQDEWELGCVGDETSCASAGVRVIPGGDYGFVWCPHGEYAKDIELFVTDMGFSPMEAIVAATKHGSRAAAAGARDAARSRRASAPTCSSSTATRSTDIAILQDRSRLAMVMADGKVMVNTLGLRSELPTSRATMMDIERIQNANAAVPTDADGGRGAALNLELNGYRAHVEEFGSGSPIVLVHGLGGTGTRIWGSQIADLAAEARVIALRPARIGRERDHARPVHDRLASPTISAPLVDAAPARARSPCWPTRAGRVDRARGVRRSLSRECGVLWSGSALRWTSLTRQRAGLAARAETVASRRHGRGRRDGRDERRLSRPSGSRTPSGSRSSWPCSRRTIQLATRPSAAPLVDLDLAGRLRNVKAPVLLHRG